MGRYLYTYIMIPNIDTFEHDISEEIKHKEASLTDIASAGGDVGNIPTPHVQTSKMLFILGGLCLIAVIATVATLFFFETKNVAPNEEVQTNTDTLPDTSRRLLAISLALNDSIGNNIGTITKSEYGYSMQVLSYTDVFSYMLKNENLYADELAFAVGSPREVSTSSLPFMFTDVTRNNQNMRVGTSGSSTIIYAFINTNTLVISSSTEGILALRGAILK